MSLAKTLSKGKEKTQIHINDIRENDKNDYQINEDEVNALALSIKTYGLLHNVVVYREESAFDNKHYTLISGAKRFRAVSLLYADGQHDGYIDATIDEKNENEIVEQDKINAANLYRRPSHETLYKEIKQKESYYEYLVAQGQRPELNKRDYVGQALGISGRQVTNIKNEFEKEKGPKKEDTYNNYLKDCSKQIKENYHIDVKLSRKGITLPVRNTEEMNLILSKLGIENQIADEIELESVEAYEEGELGL